MKTNPHTSSGLCDFCGGELREQTFVSQAMEKVLTGNEQPKGFNQVGVWDLSLGAKAHA